jgi:hypothetical protein
MNLPADGSKVKIWPRPGRKVQLGARPLDSGGRWLTEGTEVVWSSVFTEQFKSGDLLLHDPAPAPAAKSKKDKE